ncbi:MAG: GGDEF domain-containing protein [Betaproteobacteria bacterium]|nr:GGDEF domain-containing protein [Betaproteobacteria bacterium]
MLAHGKTLGIIYLSSYSAFENETLTQHRRNLAQAASDSISLALANLKLREPLHALSCHDSLTGLFNRRFMEETLARDLSRIARIDNPLVIAMLDIDRFKTINDRFGHDAGDVVLKEVARLMMGFRAGIDVPCRFGGEEFILILPETATKQALSRLEQLRISIGELNLNLNGKVIPRVTVSIGVAVFPEHGDTATALIKAADNALYRAKRNGRNRIEVADSGRSELDRLN